MQIQGNFSRQKFTIYANNSLLVKKNNFKCNNNSSNCLPAANYNINFHGDPKLTYFKRIYLQNKVINFEELKSTNIRDLEIVYNRGVRGETLSASRNTKYMQKVKECGVDTIIDLRTSDYTKIFEDKCKNFGFKYIHIPIDKSQEPDRNIIDNMPTLFEAIKRGRFYIACAQGKHRTDIALAINYVFNPQEKMPPFMSGHTRQNHTDMADINRRLNSLYKALTQKDKEKLGWPADYDEMFLHKKRILKSYSENQ